MNPKLVCSFDDVSRHGLRIHDLNCKDVGLSSRVLLSVATGLQHGSMLKSDGALLEKECIECLSDAPAIGRGARSGERSHSVGVAR